MNEQTPSLALQLTSRPILSGKEAFIFRQRGAGSGPFYLRALLMQVNGRQSTHPPPTNSFLPSAKPHGQAMAFGMIKNFGGRGSSSNPW